MEHNNLLSSFKKAVKHWWISLLVGIICIIVGIWSFLTPFSTFAALSIIFVISFLSSGISEIIFSIANKNNIQNWAWTLAIGIINLIFAIVLITNMALAPLMLCYLIAFWILLQSMWGVGMAIDLQSIRNSGWGWLLALSILGVFSSVLLLFQPAVAGLFTAYIIAIGFLSYGTLRIYLAFKLKSIQKNITNK